MSQFQKMTVVGALVFHKHILFINGSANAVNFEWSKISMFDEELAAFFPFPMFSVCPLLQDPGKGGV